jgi:hypothetical protein
MTSRYLTRDGPERHSDSIDSFEDDLNDLEPQDITREVRLYMYRPVFTGNYSLVYKGRYRHEDVSGS